MKFLKWLSKIFVSENLTKFIFVLILVLFIFHVANFQFVRVDNTTLVLLVLLLLTPFASHIKKIKWGEFEAEINAEEIKKLQKQASAIKSKPSSKKSGSLRDELFELAQRDKVLALAKVRIEIETRVKRLILLTGEGAFFGLRQKVEELFNRKVIDQKMKDLIIDTLDVLNRAVHGDEIPEESVFENILNISLGIVNNLDNIIYGEFMEPFKTEKLTEKEVQVLLDSDFEVSTIIPDGKPVLQIRKLNQEQLDTFLEDYEEYAEFLVGIKKLGK